MLQVGKTKVLVTDKSVNSTWRSDDDVRMSLLVTEELNVLLHRSSSVEDADLNVGQELSKTVVLVANLVGQFTSVAHDQDRGNTGLGLLVHLLKSGKDENGSLS